VEHSLRVRLNTDITDIYALDWIRAFVDWIAWAQQKWTHVQLCAEWKMRRTFRYRFEKERCCTVVYADKVMNWSSDGETNTMTGA